MPTPRLTSCISTYSARTITSFPFVSGVSNLSKAEKVARRPMIGFLKAMNTITMLKICSDDPDMYREMKVIGRDFAGARASS
jgi:hypothetical protein